jgi:hypothetical protein
MRGAHRVVAHSTRCQSSVKRSDPLGEASNDEPVSRSAAALPAAGRRDVLRALPATRPQVPGSPYPRQRLTKVFRRAGYGKSARPVRRGDRPSLPVAGCPTLPAHKSSLRRKRFPTIFDLYLLCSQQNHPNLSPKTAPPHASLIPASSPARSPECCCGSRAPNPPSALTNPRRS